MSPSPPLSRKRQIETSSQSQQQSSLVNNLQTYEQESVFKRSRPLTRQEDYRHIRQYPKTLEIFRPSNGIAKEQEKETIITRSYEYEKRRSSSENVKQPRQNDLDVAREYLRCLDDLTDEYEKLKKQKKSFDHQKTRSTYETTESYESIEEIYRHQPRQVDNTYQRSLSENILHQRLKPLITSDFTLSEDDLFNVEYRLKRKERLKPIHIHSSTNSIPGESSIKYVRTERLPVEFLVPKPQIIATQGEHSSTIVKDTRHSSRKITTNIHQQRRRRTIEGQHELRIIETPITSEQTRPVEFTIPKPIPTEHSSTCVVRSKKGGRFHTLDISRSLSGERTLFGEHELRIISEPIRSGLHNKPVELLFPKPHFSSSSSSHHSSTIIKQNRTPKSSLFLDNIQTTLKGEHELRLVEKPIQSGPGDSVELIIPKSVTDTAEHTTTILTETQPHRRVLEITGSGKQMESEHERKYFQETVRIEEEMEVRLPKQKREQAEHSSTIVKHSRGKGPIIEIDTTRRTIEGEHETKIFEDSIETRAETMELLIAKPQIPAEHTTTLVKEQRGKSQRFEIDRTQPIPGQHETKYYEQPIESYSEMEVVFRKQQPQQPAVSEHTSTVIKKVHSKQIVQPHEIPGEHQLTFVDRSHRQSESEVEFIVPKPQKKRMTDHYQSSSDYDERFVSSTYEEEEEETSGEHTSTYLKQARAKYEPIELVVDRPTQLPSISKLIADIHAETHITSIKPTKILFPEDSSVKLDMDLRNQHLHEQYDEMEIVFEKPIVRDSSTTLIANIQSGLELKSIQPTQQITKTITESTSTFTLQREEKSSEEDLLELRIRKPHIQDSSSILLANVQPELGLQGQLKPSPYLSQTIEESSSTFSMELNRKQQVAPFELIIPRLDIESSTSTILAQVAPTIAGLRAKVDIPQVEKSTSTFTLEQKKRLDEEVELIMPKPKHIETSKTTMLADVEAKLETKNIHPSQIAPETSTSTFLFQETIQSVIPQPVEIRMKQPTIADSSTTLLANVKATLDTQQIQRLGNAYQPIEQSSSTISFETKKEDIYPSEVELILPRPQIQESTSVMLADIRPTLDTSPTHVVIPPPFQSPIKSSSEIIFEEETLETTPVELHLHRQPSSHTLLANIDDIRKKNKDMYVLGTGYQQEQQYGSSTIHADLNKPFELILDVDEGNTSAISQQYRRNYQTNITGGADSSSTLITEIQPRQYQPVEFVVSGGLTGYDQYSTGTGGYTTTTTTTTTKRKLTSADTGDTTRSVIRGIRPYDQVDLVLQPDSSLSTSSSKLLTTSIGLDQSYSPYFSLALHDQTAREGESVLFEVIVSAQPSAEIIWDKDGELIGDDSAFRIDYYGDGRTTLYIPEAFSDDQGYYTCTATNTLGTCRTTARLTIDSTGEGMSSKRRQLNGSSTVSYQQGPRQTTETYRIYSQSSPVVTQITEETQVYQIPSHQQQQHNEITYSIQGTQPKYQPVSFLVSSTQENTQPTFTTTTTTTDEDEQSMVINPYQIFGTQLHTRPNQSIIPSYSDETSTTSTRIYSQQQQQQQPRSTSLLATVAKQAGPTYSPYQQPFSQESDSMQTESETSTIHFNRSTQQQPTSTTSYITTRPNFTKPLEPVDALEGGTVQITVHLTSVGPQQTRPQIQWYHHAQPIVPDNLHYRITEGYDTSTLEIINVNKSDTGQVWCVANTPAGSATTTCTINVEENPARTYHHLISSQQQVVPQETVYSTQSIHSTHAQIPLHQQQPEQKFPSQYYSTQTITQQQFSPQTSLSYQQEQVSPQSYTSISSQQLKQQQQQAPFQPYVPQEQSPLQYQQQQQAPFQPYVPQEQSPLQYQQPQQAPFQPYVPQEQSPLQYQQPQQAPFQPYAPQEQTPRQYQQQPQTTSAPQSAIPQAPPLLPNFNARPNYSDQQVKILDNGLQDQPLYSGSETVFECQFTGQPDKVQWFRNEVEIVNNLQQLNNRIYHVTNLTNGTSRLIIKTTLDEDIGTYSVKLSGPTGEETTSAKLIPASQFQNIQKKKTEQVQRKALVQELEEKQLKRMRPSKQAAPRGNFTSYGTSDDDVFLDTSQRSAPSQRAPTAPSVSRPLKDLDVEEGQPIQLTCQVQGFPKSELLWFKNNMPLPLSARHKIAYDAGSGTITLRVNDSRPEDSGVYTVIAKNPQGHTQTSAHIDVHESPGIDETSYVQPDAFKYIEKQPLASRPTKGRRESDTSNLQQKPAKILKTPMSTSVVEGTTATFTCQVEGNPKPKIAWLKDNKPLMSGTRFSTYFDQTSKTAVLRVSDVSKEDQGYYTCVVDNALNSDRSTATLQVIPESKIDQRSYVETDAFKYLTSENKQLRTGNKENDRRTSGVNTESFVSPDAFRYLETKKPLKEVDDNLMIDDRPIVDLDAFRYLEARQAPKGKRDEGARASIDDTPIIAPDAFRYLERKADAAKLKKNQDTGPSIDETPQVDLSAFQYLERKEIPKKPDEGPGIDESSIVNPEAFRYLERKPTKKPEDVGPLIDESPMVNPDAFRYLERQVAPQPRDTAPTIDTTSLVNPEVFKYLERPELPRIDEGPAIDTRPIVPQEAFRWLDRPTPIERKPEGPSIDESSYVNPQAFRYIDAKPKPKVIDEGPSIDESSYVNPQAFKYLEATPSKKPLDQGPTIDTSTYVNPQLFAQFEQKPTPQTTNEEKEIKRAPRVVQPLRSTQAIEGKPVALVAIVDGYPVPQLTWLKDGAELPASNRVTTNYDIPSKTAWIRIDSVRPDDSSVYTLIAHNPAGEVRSDARLNVVPSMAPIDDTAFVPAEAFAKIERATAPNRNNIPATTGVDDTAFVNPELFQQFELPQKQPRTENFTDELVIQVPARIIAPLKSIQAPESVTVVLEATVEGSPIPTFTWLKDQIPLNESNRYITNYDLPSKRVTLTIKDVRENDTGIYTLLASNGPQIQHSSATLQIIGAPSIDQSSFIPMDVFKQLERPQNQQPQVLVQSGVDQTSYISQPDRFAVFDQIQPHRKPLNDFGGVDETPLVSMEKIRLLEIPSNLAKQPYDVEEKSQAPTVLTPLQPIDTQEGSPVVLTAKIDGTPMPNFTWFKDDAPLVASSRFTTYYDIPSKLIILQINDARPNDTGVYKVRADNQSGVVETSAQLNISSLPSVRDQSFIPTDKFRLLEQPNQPRFIEEISGVDERPLVDLRKLQQLEIKPNQTLPEEETVEQFKPTILIPLRNIHVIENQPVVLSAQIEGKPQPQLTWFKNNQPLSEGNRFRTHYDIPSKTIFLTVAGAREDDSGIYRLVAQNPSGVEETSCEVTVDVNQPNIDQRAFVPQTAFDKLEKPSFKPNNVTSGVDQTSFFNQDLFRPFDERHIKHPSAIVGGEDSDAAMPVSAPKILSPLRPITTTEGDTVLLTTQVEGYPLPQFTWVHNNKPIMASNRVTPHYDMLTKRCYLQIFDSRPDDTGTYELIAENPAGQDRTRTELTVVPVSKIDQTGYVPYDKFSTLEFKPRIPSDLRSGVDATPFVSGEIFRLLEAKPINEQFIPEDEQNVPLEVLVPLKPAVAQEGQPVILTTKIRGRPTPQFTWLRNNQPLMESNRFQTHYDFPSETLVLEVSDIWPHDSGTYTVIAENPKTGERVQTSAPLTVRGDTTSIDRTAFVAPDAFRTLEAAPTLRTVLVEAGVDTNSFLTPDVLRALDQVKPQPTDTQEKEQPLTAPKVIAPLQPINTTEGQPINFTAKVAGNPTPTFTWFKNGQPLQESNRFWSHYDVPSKTVLLQINGARPDDSGTYTLVAKNPLGQDQTQAPVNVSFGPAVDTNAFVAPEKFAAFDQPYGRNIPTQSGVDTSPFVQPERFAQLEVKAPAPKKEDMEQMEAPKVVTPLQGVQVNEGSPVLLQATIVGTPTPNFVWLKDGAPLAASNRLRTRYDIGTKQVLLQINDARPQDIGEYRVVATNPVGEDATVAPLSVVPDKPGVDERAFVPTDKFRNLEHPQGPGRRPLEIVPGVDIQPFVSPDKFRNLDHVTPSTKPEEGELPEEKRAPRVIKPLTNCDLEELMPVLLTTTIDAGTPMATFTWFKNGQPLLEGNRYTTKYDILTKTLTLQILAARPDDQGVYTVRATNPTGTDETTANLTIRPVSSIDTRPFVQPERFAPLELKAPLPTKEELEQIQPPKVIVPLQGEQVPEGSPVLLRATIVGTPTPNFTWLKDNAPLAASTRLRTRYDIGTKQVLLQINDARPQDIGEYRVVATNPAGEDSTVAPLSVVPDKPGVDDRGFVPTDKFRNLERPEGQVKRPLEVIPGVDAQPFISPDKFRKLDHVPPSTRPEEGELPEEKRPPRVIKPLSNVVLEELMPVILTTTIDAGAPMATFTWFKNGQPLLEGNRYTTKYDILTKALTLQILAARPDDQGVYSVRATNPSGTDETTAKLTIQPVASIDTRPFIQPEHFAPLEVKAPAPTKEDMEKPQPPKVVVPLQNEQVKEGAPVLLQATITGKPTPNFTWLKDGAPLTASNRLRTRYEPSTNQVLLQINDARPQDVGQYLVVATNPVGKDSTAASLSVLPDKPGVDDRGFIPADKFRNLERPESETKRPLEIVPDVGIQPEENRPPRIMAPLTDSVIEESMPVLLTTKIDEGVPMATFTWFKNGQPLLEGNRYITEYDIPTKTLTLQILAARPEDQGVYTVRATNPVGSDETTAKLTIRPAPSVGKGPSAKPEQFAPLEVKAPVPTKEDMKQTQPPKVVVPLQDEQVKEGAPILLRATITGKPTPNFAWFKDGAPLIASNRLRTRYEPSTNQVLLQIDNVRPEDVGQYLVVATNPAGKDSTTAALSVLPEKPVVGDQALVPPNKLRNLKSPQGQPKQPLEIIPNVNVQPEEKRPPRIIVPLSDSVLEESMPVLLTTTIDEGVPMATFTWLKNGQPLLEGNRYITEYDVPTKKLTLQILAARPEDQGVYTVRATNPIGSDETTAKLTIRPAPSVGKGPSAKPEQFAPLEVKAPAPTKEDMKEMQPPKVVVPLQDEQVKEGAPILLRATITGKPTPNFAWFKDGAPLIASNRLRTRYEPSTNQVLLQIDNVRPEDVGQYLVVATNPAGKDSTAASLNVLSEKPVVADQPLVPPNTLRNSGPPKGQPKRPVEIVPDANVQPEGKRPPRVIVPLSDSVLEESMPVLLTTTIDEGVPMATFTWFKNGQPLVEGNRYITEYDIPTKTLTLQILAARPEDQGAYTVRALNPVGSDETTAKLTIRPAPAVVKGPSAKPEQFAPLEVKAPVPTKEDMKEMQPPKVVVPLQDEQVKEGAPILLRATITGKPTPNFAWFKDGAPLIASNRLRTRYEPSTNQVLLQINDVRPEDVGQYLVVATNPAGKDSTAASLSVLPEKPVVADQPLVPPNKLRNSGPPKGQPKRPVEIVPDANVQPEGKRPPRVIVPLTDSVIEESMPVLLTTTIDEGVPMATFTWFKNGQPLLEGNRYITEYDIPTKTLTLQILAARPEDQGAYTVRAVNPVGSDETTAKLTIRPAPAVVKGPSAKPEQFAPLEVKAPVPTKEDMKEMQPPKVVVPLQDEQVKEGAPILLRATITGKPTPNFVWFKDGAPLIASNRLRTRYEPSTNQVLLQIDNVRPEDVGQYLVVATNPAGKDSTTATLSVLPDQPGVDDQPVVPPNKLRNSGPPKGQPKRPLEIVPDANVQPEEKRPPRVIIPLSDSVIEESMPALLTTTIDEGVPMATFTWLKNGQPLLEGNRYITEYDIPTKTLTLQILAARPEDQGVYTVRAINPVGSDETTAKLTIRPAPAVGKGPSAKPEQFGPLEVKAPAPTKEDMKEMQPPKVIVPLQDEQVKEGAPILLRATITGKPTPNFVWFKDGAPLIASNRLRTRYEPSTKQVLLQIDDVRPEDVGQYLVVATNPAGKDSTTATLSVLPEKPVVADQPLVPPNKLRNSGPPKGQPKRPVEIVPDANVQPEEKRPPRVIVPLSDSVIEESMPVLLTTTIDAGVPKATFTWLKNGQPLLEGNRYITEYNIPTKKLTLQILAARPEDQGVYTVRAINPVGSDETTAKLTIRPAPAVVKGPSAKPEQFGPLEVKAPVPTKEDMKEMQPPKVIVPLQDEQVKEGAPILLRATITGKPTPNFAWFKDGAPLIASNRLRTRYEPSTKQVLLQIDDVRPEDVGQYLVVATNPAGKDSTAASLSVLPEKPVVADQALVPPNKLRNSGPPKGQPKRPLEIAPDANVQPEEKRPPRVIVPLSDSVIEESMPVLLTTTIDAGVPKATFTWLKNGQPLLESDRFTTEYDIPTKILTLQILAARPEDQGVYTVRAINPVGSDETTAKLTIRPAPAIVKGPSAKPEQFAPLEVKAPVPTKEDMKEMQPPKVIVPLQNEQVKEGLPVLLRATITGKPTPNFAWFKDGAPLIASNRLRTRYEPSTKQVLLQINDVRPEDVGQYLVVATNPAGKDSTTAALSILPEKPVVADRAVVPPNKLRNVGPPQGQAKRPLEIVPGSTDQPLVPPKKLRKLNEVSPLTRPEEGQVPEAMRPPRVIVPLNDCELEELMPVLLTATIDAGVPMASFTWFKNGQPLLEGNRYTTKYDIPNRIITLQILASRPDDQGVYTVRATNPVGSDETTCKLTIRPVSAVDTRPFVDAERFRPLEHRPLTAGNVPNEDQPLRPPKVLVPMNNVRLTEYQPIVLKSIIDAGYPMGKFTWLKDGRPLPESTRYRANFDINTRTATLFIDAARPATDTGPYTVHVENIVGKDQTTGDVHVVGTPAVDDRPFIEPSKFGKFEGPLRIPTSGPRGPILQPDDSLRNRENLPPWIRLLKELEDQLIDETKAAQLVCLVDAHPPANITWFKDGQPLIVSQRFMPDYDHKTGVVRLTIYPVTAADSGPYTMVARNIAGEVSTKCTLRIQPTASVEENPLVKFAGLRKTPQHPPGLGQEPGHKPVDADDGQKPYFIKIPVDQEVPEGQLVRLDYIPAGRPEPSLAWFRNGIPLRPDDADHRDVVNEGGVHSLLIHNPQLGPTVEYTCVAKNKFGEAPFTVHISVAERGANIAPYFIEQLYNIIIIEGQDARLDAAAQGFPQPNVAWQKEGQPLTPNKEYKVEFEGPKTTLHIRGAKLTDAGWFQCTATSPAGTCVTKCKVTVIPLSEAGQYAKDLPQFGPQVPNKLPSLPEEDIRSKYMTVPVKPADVKPEELYKLPKRTRKPDGALEEAKRRGVKVLPDEVLSAIPGNLEEYPEEEMYSKDRPQPPKFKVHLKSHLNLNEDEPCLFEAKLIPVRDPMMRVQWFKNGKILHHASRMIPRYDFADVSLEFLYTFAEDDGIYECVATNPYGEDRTRAEIKCRPKRSIIYNTQLPEGMEGVSKLQMLEDEIRYTASMIGLEEKVQEKEPKIPEFIMPLEDLSIDEGDNAKFIAKVDGHPRPRVMWSINGSDVFNGSRYKLVYDGLVHYLDIPRTRQYDAGVVRCIAKNSLGQTESVATLNLKLRTDYRSALSKVPGTIETGVDDSFDVDIEERLRLRSQIRQRQSVDERVRRPSIDKPTHPLHTRVTDRMAWHQTVERAGDAPNFTKSLLPLKAKEGSKVVVGVEFTGEPAPTVSWYRDGFMVEDSEDFKIHTTPTQSILTIKHAFIIDSGLYTVKLFNPIGIRQCQAAIRIMPIIAEDQTPRFLDIPHDTEILAGDPVRFQCRVDGEPFPIVAFYREDEPVNLNDKRFRVIQEGDVFTLLLFEALPADSGQYEAVAENSLGKANTRFTLIVTPRVPGGKKASIIDDPKLIHKVPYLEKPLEDLHVKEGQSATFECIIPASFGSDVKWYKGISEWQIKPSKFFKPKSDGTKHQLFILEAYAEDEGLYKCVVSNPVGTTATTATLKVDHAMQVPEFIHGFSNLTTYEGEQVRFEVEVRGDPPPTISWYRDGEVIRDSPDFQIFTEGNRSLFFIAEVFMEDQGLFTCTASNSAGSSDCSAHLIVQPRPQL